MRPQAYTIKTHDTMTREELVEEMNHLTAATHRLYEVALAMGKTANEPDMQSLNQCAGCAAIAAYNAYAMLAAAPTPFIPPPNQKMN